MPARPPASRFNDGSRVLTDEPAPPPPDSIPVPAEPAANEPPPRRSWRELLLAGDELSRYDGLLALFGADQTEFLRLLPGLPGAERDRLLAALWSQAEILLLEGRERARPLFAAACAQAEDPALRAMWRQLVGFYRPADPAAPLDPRQVAAALAAAPEEARQAFARALLIHPSAEVRKLARAQLATADFFHLMVSATPSLRVLHESWLYLRAGHAPDGLFQIFLSAIAGRFLGELPREQLNPAIRFFASWLEVEGLRERAFHHLVLRVERHLREEATRHGADLGADPEWARRVRDFAEAPLLPDQPIQLWKRVPLAVQRTLARRGLFLRVFACHPVDAVAAETFRHLLRRPDFVEFLKLPAINTRLMAQLAEEKQLYESDSAKFFLVANPKCPYHTIAKYLGYLSSESLTKLSQGYLYNSFARKQAERMLDQRGKAKKGR